jgi:hypothetical protein
VKGPSHRVRRALLALAAISSLSGAAEARRFRIGVVPVPHFGGSRSEPRNDDGQRLEEAHPSVTLDENGKPVQEPGIDWLSILLVLGGGALAIMMVRMALRPSR